MKITTTLVILLFPCVLCAQEVPTLDSLFDLRWKEKGTDEFSKLLINDGLVFENFGIRYASEANTGKKLDFQKKQDQLKIKEITKDSILLFTSKKDLAILNIYNGTFAYRKFASIERPWVNRPRIIEGEDAFTAINDSTFVSINILSGEIIWQKQMNAVYNVPIVHPDGIYIGDSQYLYKIDKVNGKELNKVQIGPFASDPVYENGIIYVFIIDRGLIAYDTKREVISWIVNDFEEMYQDYQLFVDEESIYLLSLNLYSISKKDGSVKWVNKNARSSDSYTLGSTKKYILVYKTVDDDAVLVACDKETGGIRYQGFAKWDDSDEDLISKRPLADLEYMPLRFGNKMQFNLLYAADIDGYIYCFEVKE